MISKCLHLRDAVKRSLTWGGQWSLIPQSSTLIRASVMFIVIEEK